MVRLSAKIRPCIDFWEISNKSGEVKGEESVVAGVSAQIHIYDLRASRFWW